jgi:hypothetical protein
MKLELEDIRDRVQRTEDEQRDLSKMMDAWEAMYKLDAGFKKTQKEAVAEEGREQVVTPDPYNAILLAMRLIPTEPKIDCPPADETDDSDRNAQQKERFLTALYPRINYQQGENFIEKHKWQLFTLGNSPIQILWVKDELPEKLKKTHLPFLIRTLDPRNVGVKRGPLYVEWAYHKYEAEKMEVRQEYPHLKKWDEPKPKNPIDNESSLVTVTDFWYRAKSGAIWHAIIVDEEFALNPVETDYPIIPIIYAQGDIGGMSLLHPMNGPWQYKCRMESNLGTSVLWYTWPALLIETAMGQTLEDWQVRPGATYHVPEGTKIHEVRPQPNADLIQQVLGRTETSLSQSAFPQVLYGDSGSMQAGYGVNILSQAAQGRVTAVREALERSLMELNQLILMLIDVFDDDNEGVELWGRDEASGKLYKTCLYKDQIQGYYENEVKFKVSTPQDDIALQTLGIRLADSKYISKQTYRDKYLKITVPSDEQDRIYAEMALENPAVQKNLAVVHLIKSFPMTWESVVKGTEIEQMAYQIVNGVREIQDMVMRGEVMPPMAMMQPMPPPPPMPIPGALPMGGPPPGMPPQGPPPGMMPPIPQNGALGNGNLQPNFSTPPIQPPQVTPMPMGGGMIPEVAGQMQGETMGMPPDLDPALFAQIMGQPMAPGDELDMMAGGPPPMMR